MIKDYFRPKSLAETTELLEKHPNAHPIGGGTSVKNTETEIVVIDLQDLSLKYIEPEAERINIGATTTLEDLDRYFFKNDEFIRAIKIEGTKNQRTQGSIGGLIKVGTGRSALLTCLLALNASVSFANDNQEVWLGDFLRTRKKSRELIKQIAIANPVSLKFDSVSRTPLDLPIVCCALHKMNNNMIGAIGGFGDAPQLIPPEYFSENPNSDVSQFVEIYDDDWASGEYRKIVSEIIFKRFLR